MGAIAEQQEMRVCVAQLGSRMHYAVPRILAEAGALEQFYADICSVRGLPRLARALSPSLYPGPLRRLIGRVPFGVPADRVTHFPTFGLQYALRLAFAGRSSRSQLSAHLWAGRTFGRLVCNRGFKRSTHVYAFSSAALEILEAARASGRIGILEQPSAPRRILRALFQEEQAAFPGWEVECGNDSQIDLFIEREEAEWRRAGLILAPSRFVAEAVRNCDARSGPCAIVPYGMDGGCRPANRQCRDEPLRVLIVATVCLLKGIQYVPPVVSGLGNSAVFRLIGADRTLPRATAELRRHVQFLGQIPRSEMHRHYAWADVLLLPSLSEGMATVVLEALASGLPVVTTPNAGGAVRDGVDGFVIPIRDSRAIQERLETLIRNRGLLREMSHNAAMQGTNYSLSAYAARLLSELDRSPANRR